MATPLVPGITFTSRVATADINSLTFQRRAEMRRTTHHGHTFQRRADFSGDAVSNRGFYYSG